MHDIHEHPKPIGKFSDQSKFRRIVIEPCSKIPDVPIVGIFIAGGFLEANRLFGSYAASAGASGNSPRGHDSRRSTNGRARDELVMGVRGKAADQFRGLSAPAFRLYQNLIKNSSESAIGVGRRAKSRFPKLLERMRKRETEWTVWKVTSALKARAPRLLPINALAIENPHGRSSRRVGDMPV